MSDNPPISPNPTGPIIGAHAMNCEDLLQILRIHQGEHAGPLQIGPVAFMADREWIVRPAPKGYIEAELEWAHTRSERVLDLEMAYARRGGPEHLSVWRRHACEYGMTIGNHGRNVWLYGHYDQCIRHLKANKHTRRAVIMYTTRGTMSLGEDRGMNDQHCTVYCHPIIVTRGRKDVLRLIVHMRAVDLTLGYPADFAWWWELATAHMLPDLQLTEAEVVCVADVATVYKPHLKYLRDAMAGDKFPTTPQECRYGRT